MILFLMLFITVFLLIIALHIFKFSNKNLFAFSLIGLVICQILWQWYVGILYSVEIFSKEKVEFLFRLLRIGALGIPTMLFLTITESLIHSQEKIGIMNKIFTRRNFVIYVIITLMFYILNWTPLTVQDLKLVKKEYFVYYYPIYGILGWTQLLQISSLLFWLSCGIYISLKMKNEYFKVFNLRFSSISTIATILGLMNFTEGMVIVTTLMSCITFTAGILYSFNSFREKVFEYERKIEVEKAKIDYVDYATSSLIHEIRNPLAVLLGYFQLIEQNESLDDDAKRMLGILKESSEHIQNIINHFVEFVKTKEINKEVKNLNKIIEKSINMMQVKGAEEDVVFHPLESTDEIYTYIDEFRFSQVLINLYKNAIDAMRGIERSKEIYTLLKVSGNQIHIEIRDTGKGIPPHIAESIFKPFKTDKPDGMGLGLSICQNIISAHKGKIEVKETSENGTTFLISLPIEDYSLLFANDE